MPPDRAATPPPAGANPLDPDVTSTGHLTSTQIQILAENHRKRLALSKAKAQLFDVARAHQELKESHQRDLDEQHAALEYLHWDSQRKAEEIEGLQQQLNAKEEQLGKTVKELEKGFAEHEERLRRGFARREQDLQSHVRSLQDTIAELETFKQDKERLETELSLLRVNHDVLKQEKMTQGMKLERKYIKQNLKMRDDFKARLEQTVREMESDLDKRLPARIHGVMAQNERLLAEAKELRRDGDALRARNAELKARLAESAVEGTVTRDVERQERETRVTQGRALREAQETMRALKRELATVLAEMEELRRGQRGARDGTEQALVEEIGALQARAEAAERDAAQVRALASEVLRQRSDVESFLVAALEDAGRRRGAERAGRGRGGAAPGRDARVDGALRSWSERVASGEPSSSGPLGATGRGGRTDVSDLSWEEREQVLRALFVKINKASRTVKAREGGGAGGGNGRAGGGSLPALPPSR